MREYKASTKRGKELLSMGVKCYWSSLHNLYDSWSEAKQKAFDWCWEQYVNDNKATAFGIGNANSFAFTCSWLTNKDGEDIMRIETKGNSYIIWIDR